MKYGFQQSRKWLGHQISAILDTEFMYISDGMLSFRGFESWSKLAHRVLCKLRRSFHKAGIIPSIWFWLMEIVNSWYGVWICNTRRRYWIFIDFVNLFRFTPKSNNLDDGMLIYVSRIFHHHLYSSAVSRKKNCSWI